MAARNLRIALALIILLKRRLRRKRALIRDRKIWVKSWIERRNQLGIQHTLLKELALEDRESYRRFIRMTPDSFQMLLDIVGPQLQKKETYMRKPILPDERLSITLRFLATGETFRSLSFLYRVGERTISEIVKETCGVISKALLSTYIQTPKTEDEWKQVAGNFQQKWNYPFCLGSIDGKHTAIRQPENSGSIYYNYKHFFSIILLALVDADCKFIYIDVGAAGRSGDAGVFSESTLLKCMNENSLNFPKSEILIEGMNDDENKMCSYHFIGDDAFPLRDDLLKPFPSKNLEHDKRIFNYRLSRARRVVENAFGLLSNRFRVFLTTIALEPIHVDKIVLSACCLHNFLIHHQSSFYCPPSYADHDDESPLMENSEWREHQTLTPLQSTHSRNAKQNAKTMRENLKHYFTSHHGSVPWQNDRV